MMFLLGFVAGIWACSLIALWMQMSTPPIEDESLIVVPQQWGEIE